MNVVAACIAIISALVASAATAAGQPKIIPIEIVDGNNIAELVIGKVAMNAHVDTGGYKFIGITPQALAQIDVRFSPKSETRTDGGGARFTGRTFTVPRLVLGGQTFNEVPGYERRQRADGSFGGAAPFDAVVGRDFLKQFAIVMVDYPGKRFELYEQADAAEVCGPRTAELRFDSDGFWISTVTTDAGPCS